MGCPYNHTAFECHYCGCLTSRHTSDVNKARRDGLNLYCGRRCSGLGRRRVPQTIEQKRAEKAVYDKARRNGQKREEILSKKNAYYHDNHEHFLQKQAEHREAIRTNPEALAAHRDEMAKYRACPKWKVHKRKYDRKYRALKHFGPGWAETWVALQELDDEVIKQIPDRHQKYAMKGVSNKAQKRKREYQCLIQS